MRAIVLTGGPAGSSHDFRATTARLSDLLADAGARVEVHTGVEEAFAALPGATLLVVNALRWTMREPEHYRGRADVDGVSPSDASRAALTAHLASGSGVLAIHTAVLCFDDWPEWGDALGGAWVWGRSHHPPLGPPVDVRVEGPHPLTDGVGGFRLVDEVYSDVDTAPEVVPLLTAGGQPMLWAREHGGGRVVYDALGHHPPSYEVPEHREILRRAIEWLTGGRRGA
ncbi:ThuA domain-containing protein [Pseudonocardia endophytica]|uniref:ThuA-like domain-containing protein n=1 Tax=Pseudonocardia endophytica TaxID=401976 RepID=A0A4R1HZN5_PSEEN|nr:ThuA domain-containing protein [Pseudonocardia endophytica]TCK26380.1 hypothetical protein EV378_2214 [Pseudonocardia endophytica]